ncbi:TetR/AcrR family transcriptional regulator C-terminal domain-containing protein [Pandoraea oxalativorans]|uniref:Tetracycline repressor TetR C-terminal domain-containing protein n=1 Tax=Pandoraea oxalativorans TaxID=573737 RepID=A0A192B1B5_9BURK|nr:TetR/AcrR family transcriptional regulator C-terminal domain-containing protein [Pandoraea oxalativorans]ANJ87109.1 hypothetical protein MB84_26485 [Pandoraea oxalativorans]
MLCTAGFAPADAARALIAISHYTVGSAMEQQGSEAEADVRREAASIDAKCPSAFLAQIFDEVQTEGPDVAFEFGLNALIEGLAARLAG